MSTKITTIKKNDLRTFITKYHLNGQVEQCEWEFDGKKLFTHFMSTHRQILGKVSWGGFHHKTDNKAKFVVYTTSKLLRMLSVLSDEVKVTLDVGDDEEVKYLKVADDDASETPLNVSYLLSRLDSITQAPRGPKTVPEFGVSLELSTALADKIIKSCDALPDQGSFYLESNKNDTIDMTLGFSSVSTNSITINLPASSVTKKLSKITFPTTPFKEVLGATKGSKKLNIHVSDGGLLKVEFSDDSGFSGYYYIVAVQES